MVAISAPVSVLIPCFNCSATLERAISSVYHQTMRPAQVILVNDASTDSSRQLADTLQKTYEEGWLRVVDLETNCGPGTARNVSWEQAKQPYVAFLDADDTWHPQKIELQFTWMREHPDVVLTGHLVTQMKKDAPPLRLPEQWRAWHVTPKHLLISNRFHTSSVMLRRDVPYRSERGWRFLDDYLLWLRIVMSGLSAWRLEVPVAFRYKKVYGEGGLSGKLWDMEKEELDVYKNLRGRGDLNALPFWLLYCWSLAKYNRRLIVSWLAALMSRLKEHRTQA